MATGERIRFVQGGAGKLRVSDGGEGGVPVVLVHGLGSELETWRPVLDPLRAVPWMLAWVAGHATELGTQPEAEVVPLRSRL